MNNQMIFKLTLHIGNDAMSTSRDVSDALTSIAQNIRYSHIVEQSKKTPHGHKVMDANGNSVGDWIIDPNLD